MKKKLILALALMLALGSLAGCGKDDNTDGEAPSDDTINIGVNYELSGPTASYGQASLDGIKMAVDEINAAGGIKGKQIKLVEYDNKSESAESTALAEKMMSKGNIVAALGPATSGNFQATIPASTQFGIPVLSSSATADENITTDRNGKLNDYVFRICFTDSLQGVAMANFAQDPSQLNAKKAVIIKDTSSDYAKGLAKNFKETFTANGGEIVEEENYVAKDKDFSSILTNIKAKDFDVIFIPGYYEEAGLIIKQARDLGIEAPILGADGFDSPVLLKLAGEKALNDVYFSNHYSELDDSQVVQEFITNFNKKYDKAPNSFMALGYDLGMFIADAIERADSEDPEAIKNAIAATENFSGVTGDFSIDEKHNAKKSVIVIGLKDGKQASATRMATK